MKGKGHIRPRGKNSWEIRTELGRDPATGKRRSAFRTVRGTKREAQVELAKLIASIGKNGYIEPSKVTVAEHVRGVRTRPPMPSTTPSTLRSRAACRVEPGTKHS
jgi:hypothetical protein